MQCYSIQVFSKSQFLSIYIFFTTFVMSFAFLQAERNGSPHGSLYHMIEFGYGFQKEGGGSSYPYANLIYIYFSPTLALLRVKH